jgi:outer membrane protein assembly factor BamB
MRRRGYLALVMAGALAGCLGGGGGDSGNQSDTGSSSDDEPENGSSDGETGDADNGSASDPDLLTRQWQTGLETNRVDLTRYGAATADGAVFVGTQGGLTALERTDGTERWRREEFQSFTRVHADSQAVVALTREDQLVALDVASGSTRWTTDVEGAQAEVIHPSGLTDAAALVSTAAGTTLYDRGSGDVIDQVGDSERGIVADGEVAVLRGGFEMVRVDPTSGAELWRTEVETTRGGAVGAGTVVSTSPDRTGEEGSAVAVDAESGDILWETPVSALGAGFPQVDIGGGVATFRGGPFDGPDTLHVLDLENGSERFTAGLGEVINPSPPLATSEFVIAETGEEEFVAFDQTTGEERAATSAPFLTLDVLAGDGQFLTCARDVTGYRL